MPNAARRAAAVVVTSVAAVACGRGSPASSAPAATVRDSSAAQMAFGVRHSITPGGVRRAELRADTALFDDSGTRVELRRVRVTFYSPAGDSIAALAAPAATYDIPRRHFAARGTSSVWTASGRRVTATRLTYDGALGRLVGDGATLDVGPAPVRAPAAPRPTRR